MAQQRRRTIPSSEEAAAGPTTRRLTLRGGKRERLDEEEEGDNSAEASRSLCKRPRMAQAGAGREEVLQDTQHDGGEDDGEESSERAEDPKEACPITDKHEKPFRLMDMPPEIRVEIYRACLTRPFHILLSKEPKPVDREKEGADSMLGTEERDRSVDSSGLDGSEDDVTLLHRGPDSGIGNPVDAAGGDNGGSQAWPGRYMRALRSMTRNNALRSAGPNAQTANNANDTSATPAAAPTHHSNRRALRLITNAHTNTPSRDRRSISSATVAQPRAPRPQDEDPLLVNLLRASKLVYKEARAILYGENTFLLDLDTAQPTLAALHQRSRGQIRDLRVTIPTHNDILEHFTEVIRLSIRYCWRLQRLVLNTPFVLPGAEGSSTSGNTTVYANAFDILRWLPKRTEVVLEGNVCEEIRRVVEKNSNLAKSLDELAYARRQLISNDGQQLPITGQEDFKRQPGAS